MRRVLPMLLTVAAVAGLPRVLAAADDPRPDGPGRAEVLFQRLDANHDGVLTADEIPAGAPERVRAILGGAIEKSGGKLTLEQLRTAINEAGLGLGRGPRSASGRPGPLGPPNQPGPPRPPGQGDPAGGPGGFGRGGGFGGGGFGMGPGGPGPGAPAAQAARGPAQPGQPGAVAQQPETRRPAGLRAIFDHLDKDKDGKLSFDEFAAGVKSLHQSLMARAPWMRRGPGLPWGDRSPMTGPPGRGWWSQGGPGPRGPQMGPGPHWGWWSWGGPRPHGPQMGPGRPHGPWDPWAETGRRAWQGQRAMFGPWMGSSKNVWDGMRTAWADGSKRLAWTAERTRPGEMKPPKVRKPPTKGEPRGDKVQQLEKRMDAIEAKLDLLLSRGRENK